MILQSSLQKARKLLLDDGDIEGEEVTMKGTLNIPMDTNKRNAPKISKSVVGFKTGGGRAVSVSEESLKHARNLITGDVMPNDGTIKSGGVMKSVTVGQLKNTSAIQMKREEPNVEAGINSFSNGRTDQNISGDRNLHSKVVESRVPARTGPIAGHVARRQVDPQKRFGKTGQGTGQKPYKREYTEHPIYFKQEMYNATCLDELPKKGRKKENQSLLTH